MSVYKLRCGKCLNNNNVQGADAVFSWTCSVDSNVNCSSIPCAANGTPIASYSIAPAILDPIALAAAVLVGNIIISITILNISIGL